MSKVLVLSPHMDDEVLGVGGTLLQCNDIHIHYFNNHHPNVPDAVYRAEAEKVKEKLNATTSYTRHNALLTPGISIPAPTVNKLHMLPIAWFISEIEDLINKLKPHTLFIPAYSRNQDHRVVHEAAITATRFHDTNYFVPNVLVYEQNEYMPPDFIPNVYVPINGMAKLSLFSLYESQQRGHRRLAHIASLAKLRGMQCNEDHAEAFMAVRMAWQPI